MADPVCTSQPHRRTRSSGQSGALSAAVLAVLGSLIGLAWRASVLPFLAPAEPYMQAGCRRSHCVAGPDAGLRREVK